MICARRTLMLLVAAAVSGCSPSAPKPAPDVSATAAASAADPAVDFHEPGQVCDAFAAAVYLVDTTVDRAPQDGYRRAAAYLDTRLTAVLAVTHPVPQTVQWQNWAVHRAYADVRLDPYAGDALPPPTDGEAHRAVVVTVWPIGRDGWRGPAQRHTVVCTLRLADTGWRVSDYETG